MAEDLEVFEAKIKASFEKVRKEIESLREDLSNIKGEISAFKTASKAEFSIGNEGVPTDKQTDKPTVDTYSTFVVDTSSTGIDSDFKIPAHFPTHSRQSDTKIQQTPQIRQPKTQFNELTSLFQNLKTDLKNKFKSLTKQEFYIFSALFIVEKELNQATYRDIAIKTNLSESSVRDYITKIIKKGIPVIKEKLNNKVTVLKIPEELRNLATLDSLLRLRGGILDENLDKFGS